MAVKAKTYYSSRSQLPRHVGENGLFQHADPEIAVMLRGESEFEPRPRRVERLHIARNDVERSPRRRLRRGRCLTPWLVRRYVRGCTVYV